MRIRAALVAGAAGLALMAPMGVGRVDAQEPSPLTVTAGPTTGLADGDAVTVTIKTTEAFPVNNATVRLCRHGVDYQVSTAAVQPASDFASDGPNCPSQPISSSADREVNVDNLIRATQRPDGHSFVFRVGVGQVTWELDDHDVTLQCDEETTCDLVVEVLSGPPDGPVRWRPFVFPLDLGGSDPVAGCGGPAPGILNSAGSDRMSDAWIGWTIDECAAAGRGSASGAVLTAEGEAVGSFARGTADLAYTGLGYLEGAELTTVNDPRPGVLVPVALNAVVIAVAGGRFDADHLKVPYEPGELELTNAMAANMFSNGEAGFSDPERSDDLLDLNPVLAASAPFDHSTGEFPVATASEASAVQFLASRYFSAMAAADWKRFGEPRGIISSFATADPDFIGAVTTYTGRSTLRRILSRIGNSATGAFWVLTDLATARAFDLTVVELPNDAGRYVSPTPESMLAAVEDMTETPEGVRLSTPQVTGIEGEVEPYPLTFIEYAMAPTQPLFTLTCAPRPESNALLTAWLDYLVGDGQQHLPAGMVALPANLIAQAHDAVEQVGATPSTKCAPVVTTTTSTSTTSTTAPPETTTTAAPEAPATTAPPSTSSNGNRRSAAPPTTTTTLPPPTTTTTEREVVVLEDDGDGGGPIPAFAGRWSAGAAGALVGLLGIVLLSSIATLASTSARRNRGAGS